MLRLIRYNTSVKRQRKTGCGFGLLILISLVILSAAWIYTAWRSSQAVLPPGLVINGMSVGGMTRDQALLAIEQAYTTPITVTYAGEVLPPLLPEMIELRVDVSATAENLDDALIVEESTTAFLRYLMDRVLGNEHETIEVKAVVLYSRERLNAFLERTAQKYDHEPRQLVALPESGTFRPAEEGTNLDATASLPGLINAILAANQSKRQVALVVSIEPAPEADINVLGQAIQTVLSAADSGTIAGTFAKDLKTGQEYCFNCDVAFTGVSAAQLGIALTSYRDSVQNTSPEETALIAQELSPTDTAFAAADTLLTQLGNGHIMSGTHKVTTLFLGLGLESSYLITPLATAANGNAETTTTSAVPTPANTNTNISANPHPGIQTTPMEAGLLIENIYYCASNGGALRILYPRTMTPMKCQHLLDTMIRHRSGSGLGRDLPLSVSIAHQQAQYTLTHSEIALFYGPRTDFLLTVFLYHPDLSADEVAVSYLAQIGRLAYRFYNGD